MAQDEDLKFLRAAVGTPTSQQPCKRMNDERQEEEHRGIVGEPLAPARIGFRTLTPLCHGDFHPGSASRISTTSREANVAVGDQGYLALNHVIGAFMLPLSGQVTIEMTTPGGVVSPSHPREGTGEGGKRWDV
jgi:hypothetical protein